MNKTFTLRNHALTFAALLLAFCFAVPGFGQTPNGLVIFGDSLSDPGNHFVQFGMASHQPFEVVPDWPYAIGGHHFSNGATWAEQLTRALSTPNSGAPALRAPGVFTNYAVGRARARQCTDVPAACPGGEYPFSVVDLKFEVDRCLVDSAGTASPDAVYVIWIGNNDLQDALAAAQADPTLATSVAIIHAAIGSEAAAIQSLYAAGARTFLVPAVANFALTPAVRALGPAAQYAAAMFAGAYNGGLAQMESQLGALPGIHFITFDTNTFLGRIEADPAAFGLANAMDPCLTFGVVGNAICASPEEYLFWDGIHPTRRGHSLLASAIRRAIGM